MHLEEIVASDAYQRFGPVLLPTDVLGFVFELVEVAGLSKAMIPREALLSAAVQNYLGEVENGGHNGFIGNLWWNAELRDEIRAGLDRIGLEEPASIFSDLEAYEKNDPESFHGSDWSDPILQSLDDWMNRIVNEAHQRHADWLLSLPNMRIVPDADYPGVRWSIITALQGNASSAN